VDDRRPESILRAALGADLLWLESPTNPMLDLIDLATLLPMAAAAGLRTVVDNTFATPMLQQPLELGAWAVSHSATKYLGGHSDLLMGAVSTRNDLAFEALHKHRTLSGAIPGTMEAFLALRGLRTLPVRFERQQATAAVLAARLREQPGLLDVRYPGSGAMVSFVMDDAVRADAAIARLQLIISGTSLGGVETTVDRRRRWAGEDAVPEGLIRMSVGLEHPDDLWADLRAALDD
jgi:cystathionine gamma-synthase